MKMTICINLKYLLCEAPGELTLESDIEGMQWSSHRTTNTFYIETKKVRIVSFIRKTSVDGLYL